MCIISKYQKENNITCNPIFQDQYQRGDIFFAFIFLRYMQLLYSQDYFLFKILYKAFLTFAL